MKKIFFFLVCLTFWVLPWHGILVTTLQCKFGVDLSVFRFWKEGMILLFLLIGILSGLKDKILLKRGMTKINLLIWFIFLYVFICLLYIYIPHFHPEASSFLGFRYDIFFLLAFLAGYMLDIKLHNVKTLLKWVFWTTSVIVAVFLLWYVFFDIWTTVTIFWFSSQLSVFDPYGCLSFSQNIAGNHRLQATFWWPIRYSIYLVITYFILLGAFIDAKISTRKKYIVSIIWTFLVLLSIFFSYSKTSYIGFLLGVIVFLIMGWKVFMQDAFSKKYLKYAIIVTLCLGMLWMYMYRDLFLHIWSMLKRFENLIFSFELLRNNIFWYGLGVAGPASMIATHSHYFEPFLPENWYIQVWLETGVFGSFVFVSILWLIGERLLKTIWKEKRYYSIGLFCAFICLCGMALFTHSFEEAATSYLLFFLIGVQFKNITQ